MPTGYTAPIYEGKDITFREFVLRCSRQFGARIMERENSLDSYEWEPEALEDRYDDRVEESMQKLQEAMAWTDTEANSMAALYNTKHKMELAEHARKVAERRSRYEDMLVKVHEWRAPTAEHKSLKKFMIDQLTESIKFDCGDYADRELQNFSPVTGEEYKAREIEIRSHSLKSAIEHKNNTMDTIKGRNKWMQELIDSLEDK